MCFSQLSAENLMLMSLKLGGIYEYIMNVCLTAIVTKHYKGLYLKKSKVLWEGEHLGKVCG